MSSNKMSEGEWKVMNAIWDNESINARGVVEIMAELEGWNKNTTYTVINRLIQKGLVERIEPAFICKPLVSKDEVTYSETRTLLDKLYKGSLKMMVSNFLNREDIDEKEIEEIRKIINSKGSDSDKKGE